MQLLHAKYEGMPYVKVEFNCIFNAWYHSKCKCNDSKQPSFASKIKGLKIYCTIPGVGQVHGPML